MEEEELRRRQWERAQRRRRQRVRERRRRIRQRRRLTVLFVGLVLLVVLLIGIFRLCSWAVSSLTAEPVEAAAVETTTEEPVQKEAEPVETQTQTVTTTSGLNVRKGPGTTFDKITLLSGGSIIYTAAEQNNWTQLATGQLDGYWVCSTYISPAELTSVEAKISTAGSGICLRSGPSTDFSIVTKIPNGTAITYLYITNYNGSNWYYTKYGNTAGWVSSQYVVNRSSAQTKND